MKKYRIKEEFFCFWNNCESYTDEWNIVDDAEIERCAREWYRPENGETVESKIAELMEQVEEI